MTTYDFQTQFDKGKRGEEFLDTVFRQWYSITEVTREEQRQGIDRLFERGGVRIPVEYKTDDRAQHTHNAFIETTSVDSTGKSGWAYTSQAQWLMYYVPGDELIYILTLEEIRRCLPTWTANYPLKSARNETYKTWGLCVPLEELERIAQEVLSV